LPIIVAVLAFANLIGAGMDGLPAMLAGVSVGGLAGWQLEREGSTRRLANGRIWLPGEWWSFSQLVVVLVFRYATTVAGIMNPELGTIPFWHLGTVGIAAGLSGLFLGRTAARLRVYFASARAAA